MGPARPARTASPALPAPGANLTALRDHNTAVVLGLLRDAGAEGASRAELAAGTGLTPQAVSKITARLRAAGLAADAGRRASTGGKPPVVLRLVPGAAHAVGLHLDRDSLTATLVDLTGAGIATRTAPLAFGAGAEAVLEVVTGEVRALLAEAEAEAEAGAAGAGAGAGGASGAVPGGASRAGSGPGPEGGPDLGAGPGSDGAPGGLGATSGPCGGPGSGTAPALLGIGVAVPGPLDHRAGVLRKVTGFPQWDGFPLRDALAERLGVPVVVDKDTNAAALGLAPRAADSFAYLHLGTGLGAGLVLGRNLHRGARTDAGEFGHQVIQVDGPPCPCGGHGCAEVLCLAAVAAGDTARAARLLGIGAANLVRLLDIDLVLLGGRTVLADPGPYVAGVRAVLAGAVPVGVTPSGDRTVVEGAAELVLAPLFGRAGAPGATAFTSRDGGPSVPPSV
ncbi:ROK family protein [Streptomyces sp. HU2014]|uniref:ROK family protein n=1 Tax=Streptomyces sp. HU2014 TaxID=2939414 RepID=UPI00200F7168|nr:ROK family protein [Streptomyces sp. HU2014]UQI49189.1 ROK family protein [Streptomyces sp. HU2014]